MSLRSKCSLFSFEDAVKPNNFYKVIEAVRDVAEWNELISHTALATLSKSKFNKPCTIPSAKDVQLLHKYLEKKSATAMENLQKNGTSQSYAELARVTLPQIIIFNRRRAGEVSKMTLEAFMKRDQTELHEDID
ncbi:hypothetical protein F7725_021349, partial [Dissostichus mawsoni]